MSPHRPYGSNPAGYPPGPSIPGQQPPGPQGAWSESHGNGQAYQLPPPHPGYYPPPPASSHGPRDQLPVYPQSYAGHESHYQEGGYYHGQPSHSSYFNGDAVVPSQIPQVPPGHPGVYGYGPVAQPYASPRPVPVHPVLPNGYHAPARHFDAGPPQAGGYGYQRPPQTGPHGDGASYYAAVPTYGAGYPPVNKPVAVVAPPPQPEQTHPETVPLRPAPASQVSGSPAGDDPTSEATSRPPILTRGARFEGQPGAGPASSAGTPTGTTSASRPLRPAPVAQDRSSGERFVVPRAAMDPQERLAPTRPPSTPWQTSRVPDTEPVAPSRGGTIARFAFWSACSIGLGLGIVYLQGHPRAQAWAQETFARLAKTGAKASDESDADPMPAAGDSAPEFGDSAPEFPVTEATDARKLDVEEGAFPLRTAQVPSRTPRGTGGTTVPKEKDIVTANVYLEYEQLPAGKTCRFAVILDVRDGWHINANPPQPEERIATTVSLASKQNVTLLPISYPKGEPYVFPGTKDPVMIYEDRFAIRGEMTIPEDASGEDEMTLTVRYQACNDETCLAPKKIVLKARPQIVGPEAKVRPLNEKLFAQGPTKTSVQ